jgi:hypothetical protein
MNPDAPTPTEVKAAADRGIQDTVYHMSKMMTTVYVVYNTLVEGKTNPAAITSPEMMEGMEYISHNMHLLAAAAQIDHTAAMLMMILTQLDKTIQPMSK